MDQKTRPQEAGPAHPWTDEAIREQLNRILGHAEFHATEKMRGFLRFVVEETLAGRSEHIKGFTIAVEVYGRDEDFDAAHDPVVRIQAGRLRRSMERYYLVAGTQDPIRIEIPKGSYVPVFTEGPGRKPSSNLTVAPPTAQESRTSWPSVLVLPFEDMTGNPDLSYLGSGLATELCLALGQCEDLRVMLQHPAVDSREVKTRPDFVVSGNVRCDGSTFKIVVQLRCDATGEQIWADSLTSQRVAGDLLTFQEEAANIITAQIATGHGVIARRLTMQIDSSAAKFTSYEAVLKGYAYHHYSSPALYKEAFEALQEARKQEPECGLVCSMLAVLYIDNISLEFLGPDHTPLDEAVHIAREGALLLPKSQFSRLVLARAHMLEDKLNLALNEVEAALALHPKSLLFMDEIGYLLLLLGEWERGEELVREAIQQNPFCTVHARYGLWLNAIRQQDYARALEETEITVEIGDFWGPLAQAATLGLLGCFAEGREAVDKLLLLKPNFQERGRILIGHYVKFPDIADQIIEGLALAGLAIDCPLPVADCTG